jgi:hypothetical protein
MFKIIRKAGKKIIFGTAKSAIMFASLFMFKKVASKIIKKPAKKK